MKDFLKLFVFAGLFTIPLLTLYVQNEYFFPFITGKNFAFRIIVEFVFAAWVLLALLDRTYRPRFSWIFSSFSALIVVMFFANLFGEHVQTGFFSNFERMDGYITLAHVYLLVVVMGSVFTEKKYWHYFVYTTLTVAFFVALHGISSAASAGVDRIDGRLGNAAYMAVYMLFHVFLAFWMFVESRSTAVRIMLAGLVALFMYTLIGTGTRGTAIGLVTGTTAMVAYVGLFATRMRQSRGYAIAAFVAILLAGSAFYLGRDSEFVQSNPSLARVANISLGELQVRGVIWGMAFEGVKERPVLGWGQGNFNYVFNKYYDPFLWGQEQWFDRVHNIFLDWLIAGGVLGFVSYISIFMAALYYLFWLPLVRGDERFTVFERAVFIGLLVGYMTHNLVVFDNIVSYIYFAVVLALIHSRVGEEMPKVQEWWVDQKIVTQFAAPVALALVVLLVYTMHVPNMHAAKDIIDSYRAKSPTEQLEAFERALSRGSFAKQEIVEQFAQHAMNIARNQNVPENIRNEFVTKSEEALLEYVKEKPGDARLHVFLGTFYRSINNPEKAAEQMKIARDLSPKKQAIIAQQGIVEFTRGDNEAARDYFKEAFDLDQNNPEAREYYATSLFLTGKPEEAKALVNTPELKERYSASEFFLNGVNVAQDTQYLTELFEIKVRKNPENAQFRASLAFLYHQLGDKERAIEVLEQGGKDIPSFKNTASCIAENIRNNREPNQGCSS